MNTLNINSTEVTTNKEMDKWAQAGHDLFSSDILDGLQASPKRLPSKYFYDTTGDKLFQEIMNCEEYYPFNCELEIFSDKTAALAEAILAPGGAFNLVELGAGDCTKSSYLLRHLTDIGADYTYMPIDISSNIINYLNLQLPVTIPGIQMTGLNGDYFDMLHKAGRLSNQRKVVLFLGSNLGNMLPTDAERFCRKLREHLQPGDMAIIGLDLKKCPRKVLAAYNDKGGITKKFNLNLLERINREMEGNFNVSQFDHFPVYDPGTGACKSYLISMADQEVTIHIKGKPVTIRFKKEEAIFMEISQKYSVEQVSQLGLQASFETLQNLYDSKGWFIDTMWLAV